MVSVEFVVRLLLGYGFGGFFVYGGAVQFQRAITRDYENLSFSRFRVLMSALGLQKNQRVLRLFWLFGGPLCILVGTGYIGAITLLLGDDTLLLA